ncbi:MAG: ABC-type amino acid transport substrate-binding protein [Desulforhopalus sp.]|jgi:ABC-type amino acid transport substrate-binding protein
MAIRADWPELVSILNKGITSFTESEMEAFMTKWFHFPQQEKTGELTLEEQAWLVEHPEISFAFSADYPPGLIVDEDGNVSGQFKDLIDLLNQRLGTNFGITVADIKAVREMAANKEVAGQLALTAGNGASRGLLETDVLWESYPVIFAPKDSPMKISALEDLKGKAVSTLKGSRYAAKILAPYQDKIDIVRADTIVEAFRLLYEGKVDYMIGFSSQTYYLTKMRFLTLEPAFIMTDRPTKIVMGVRDDWPKLVEILNKGLKSITEDELLAINDKWLGPSAVIRPQLSLTLEEQAWLEQNQTVRVRTIDWPPYMIINENKPPQGITVEYLKLVEEKTGINFEYEVTKQPFAEFLENIKHRHGPDMAPFISLTPDREQYLSFSAPYISSPYVIFAREQDELFLDISGLTGKTVAVPRGFVMQELLERDFPAIKLLLFENDEQALLAVSTGKADGYIGNLTVASHIIQKRGLSNIRVVASTLYGDQLLSMGNRSDWPELTSIINKALASISEEEKTAIQNKYVALRFEQGINRAVVLRWILVFVVVATTVLTLFIAWNWQLRRKVGVRTADLEADLGISILPDI